MYAFYVRPFKPMEKNDADIINLFCFTLHDAISKWGENLFDIPPHSLKDSNVSPKVETTKGLGYIP
jgi:hypothetical protein